MKFTLLMEDSKGRRDGMRVIANGLPDALFCFAVNGEQEHSDFLYGQREISPADEPFETYSPEETEKFVAWKNSGNAHEQKTIREVH